MAIFLVFLAATWMASRCSEAAGPIYVVEADAALLRDYPSPDSGILTRLHHLDQAEYLDANASGWWKVRSLRTGVVGWMTSDLLAAAAAPKLPPSIQTKAEYYYVNTPGIELRIIPLHSSATTGTVQLNDRVEKLGASPEGWMKVRNPRDGRKGWLPTRYLSAKLVSSPQAAGQTPKKRVKRAYPAKKKQKIEKTGPVEEIPKPM
jgi:hypothetical protein